MSSLIEQAALRLEQLRQAGIPAPRLNGTAALAHMGSPAAIPVISPAAQDVGSAPASSRRVDLDFPALAQRGILTPGAARSQTGDQFRVIKRPLIGNVLGKGASRPPRANLIMITSAVAGEGKTFTSVNLAMSLAAELDFSVLLVDADVARPSIPKVLGLPSGPGLLDLLDGSTAMSQVLLKTNIEKLTVLQSGTPHPRATEMLASDAMHRLLDEMGHRYPDRVIIFDSPPLLLTTESRTLAAHMGQIVVVVQAGQTLQGHVQSALAAIEFCPVKLLILNQARSLAQDAYGYGYGYGYGGEKLAP